MSGTSPRRSGDGVRLALLNNRLESVARKMANTLLRTGRSGVLNIARDFSCCIVTRDDRLLATAESLPIHVLSGPDLMAASVKQFHKTLRRGDAFLHNSPYHGCSHPADHTILVPVIDEAGVHHFTVLAKAHQADCGNSQPTTYMGNARDVYHEGALIFPAVKVQQDYENIDDVIRMCQMRIRVPEQWWGDFLAMIGAARIGERELLALAGEVGWDALHEHEEAFFDYTEQRMIAAIRQLKPGKGTHRSTHDHFPGTPETGVPIRAEVTVDIDAATIDIDLRDNPDCMPCGLNLSEACARTAAMVGLFNSIDHGVPKNAGAFRRLRVHLRENCIVGIPRHPTSCSVATTNLADRVANCVQAAFAAMAEGQGLAESGAIIPPAAGVISGEMANGTRFVNQVFLGLSGGPGAPGTDAWQTLCHVGNAGLCFQDSIELDELRQPIHIHARRFMADTEGAGRHSGASSILVEFGPIGCDIDIGYVSDGTDHAPQGVRGGLAGAPAQQVRVSANGETEALPGCAQVLIRQGERVRSFSCGGGGYGPPSERDPAVVARDVREGWISAERARTVYRVALDAAGAPDAAATAALRS
ncbi:MAG: hydantoinase B/oxoprolinase family protein [Alphaproteobacteria bacterium]|nr:hydantoinase B/oxoprolinase family protein [Alphaproteobacteria bacterium]